MKASFDLTDTALEITEKSITLDLNGQTLTCKTSTYISVTNTGALTLSDSGVVGQVENTEDNGTAIQSSGRVMMTSGTIHTTGENSMGIKLTDNGSFTASGTAKILSFGSAISNESGSTGTITVKDNATVTGTDEEGSSTIFNNGIGTVNIDGGIVQKTGTGSVIHNSNTGTINVTGGKLILEGNNTSRGIYNNAGWNGSSPGSNPTGAVNITGGEIVANGDDSVAIDSTQGTLLIGGNAAIRTTGNGCYTIYNSSGTLTIDGNATVRATGDNSIAIYNSSQYAPSIATVSGSAIVEATGKVGTSAGEKSSFTSAIFNADSLTVGGDSQVRTTEDGGIAVINESDFTLNDNAILESTGESSIVESDLQVFGGSALVTIGTTINGGRVRVTKPGGVAIWNLNELNIKGGNVGRVELLGLDGSSPTTYVYGQTNLPNEPTGVPIIISDRGYRIKVTKPSAAEIGNMLSLAIVSGATLPSADDPLAFFELELQNHDAAKLLYFPKV